MQAAVLGMRFKSSIELLLEEYLYLRLLKLPYPRCIVLSIPADFYIVGMSNMTSITSYHVFYSSIVNRVKFDFKIFVMCLCEESISC